MATDPICFAIVDEDAAQFTTEYKGKTYYFCTNYCRKQFLKNPGEIYASQHGYQHRAGRGVVLTVHQVAGFLFQPQAVNASIP